jgi:methylglyoxal synthase
VSHSAPRDPADAAGVALLPPVPPEPAGLDEPPAGARVAMPVRKRIALIAHDERKGDLLDWAAFNQGTLAQHELFGTGTTGGLVADVLGLRVERFLSGPLGGDQQVGAGIAEGRLDLIVFFWDPLRSQPHDVDVKALLRIAVVHNIPIACNRATADFMLSSPLMGLPYERMVEGLERAPS